MNKFRLPRKIKKKLSGMFLYPADEDGSSLSANPTENQEDYTALKRGIVRDFFDRRNAKAKRKEFSEKIDAVTEMTDEDLKSAVDDVFRKDIRDYALDILVKAKNSPIAISAYHNFVNAYLLLQEGQNSYGNICCLALDRAKELLKNKMKKK